jgi:hypothetical protein
MIKRIQLNEIAHARSGDKGNHCNVGLIAREDRHYETLKTYVTAEKVKEHFKSFVKGNVIRYEMDNICALNFVLENSLAGGGTTSLRIDSQGKTLGQALLAMVIEVVDVAKLH